jgi:putative Mn2+ efflux pump MntP
MNAAISPLDETVRARAGGAVSWGAILAGSVVAVALSAALFVLGAGVGLSENSLKSTAITVAIWSIVTQWLSAAAGGFITGRLRHRWLVTHEHEVFFRDTAHGLAMWAVATIVLAALVAGAFGGAGGHRPLLQYAPMSSEARGTMPAADRELDYEVARLLGPVGESGSLAAVLEPRREAGAIVAHDFPAGTLTSDNREILSKLIIAGGVSADEAHRRVESLDANLRAAKERSEAMRKAAAKAALFAALSMLIGAFIASVAAAIGGRMRDAHS